MPGVVVRSKRWREANSPKKILVIRFQALGDLMITLPYLQSLKEKTPGVQLHLVTRDEVSEIPKSLTLFEKIYVIGGGRNSRIQFFLSLLLLPSQWIQRYDAVIDLQNHWISRIIRKLVNAKAWSEFDRSSRVLAGDRTKQTIDALGLSQTTIAIGLKLTDDVEPGKKLKTLGWDGKSNLIILNPAGAFDSRQWPLENYIAYSKIWIEKHGSCRFLILGLNSLKAAAVKLKDALGENLIDIVGVTSAVEAFAMVKLSTLVLTEDSGLMHMAWIQGVPTVALFGSSPSYWSAPLGPWSKCLNSSDLPCGDCFLRECKYGDVHCLTRYSPQQVVEECEALLASLKTGVV